MASPILISSLLLLCFAGTCCGTVLFSSLERTLLVESSAVDGAELKAGEDKITVTWNFNQSFPATTDDAYKKVKVKLCYAPISQVDRAWRKTKDEIKKDKTCQFNIVDRPYDSSINKGQTQTFEWTIKKDIPTATYFIRAYAYDGKGHEVAYGQTSDAKKTTNLFIIQGISGRHASLDIAAGCFSGFSLLALCLFFYAEKRQAKKFPAPTS